MKRSDNRGRGPRVGVCVKIDSDLHHRQRGIAECGVDALPAGWRSGSRWLPPTAKATGQPPPGRRPDRAAHQLPRYARLQNTSSAPATDRGPAAQRRPSSIRSRISRLPRVTPLLIARIRWAAARAVSRLNLPLGQHQTCDLLAMPRDDHFLALRDPVEQLSEPVLRLKGAHLTHKIPG